MLTASPLVGLGMPKDNGSLYIDTIAAEQLFRHKIIRLLKSKDLLSDERIELLDSFRHSGFSVDASLTVWPQDTEGLERLCQYLLRCPLSLSRIHWTPQRAGAKTLFYEATGARDDDPLASHPQGEALDVFEFLARVLTQIQKPRKRAEGDSENLGSSRIKKTRRALATRALATDFRPRHLSEYPDTRTVGVSLHTHPSGGRHSSTALPCLLELCYPHRGSIGLHSPIPGGKIRTDRGQAPMNFPIFSFITQNTIKLARP